MERMDHIGKILKQIRTDKKITQAIVIEGIGSTTYISKIENGKINPTYSNLLKILDRLNVTPSEFYRITNSTNSSSQFEFINRLSCLIREKDIYLLAAEIELELKKYSKDKNFRHLHNSILLRQYRNLFLKLPINKSEIKQLSTYLLNVEMWGIYEVNLYNLCVIFFSNQLNQQLYRIAGKSLCKFVTRDQYYTNFVRIGFKILLQTIESDDSSNIALKIIEEIEDVLTGTKYYYEIVKLNFMEGIYLISRGDWEKGRELSLSAIDLMYKLGDEANARAHSRELEKYDKYDKYKL